jgi:hypothetical protein
MAFQDLGAMGPTGTKESSVSFFQARGINEYPAQNQSIPMLANQSEERGLFQFIDGFGVAQKIDYCLCVDERTAIHQLFLGDPACLYQSVKGLQESLLSDVVFLHQPVIVESRSNIFHKSRYGYMNFSDPFHLSVFNSTLKG